jgi:hypothetical protein
MNVELYAQRTAVTFRWWAPALVVLGAFVLQVLIFRGVLQDYFPTADDVAVAAVSTDAGGPAAAASSWLTDGFHNYFNCDQEWPWVRQTTNFVRPLGNLLYWLCYSVFGANWSGQLLVGYLVHALTVALVLHLALNVLRLPRSSALAATLVALLNPAYLSRNLDPYIIPWEVQFPVYQFEVFAAFLSVLSIICFLRRNVVGCGVLATLAVFFKETALTVPVSSVIQVGAWCSPDRLRLARRLAFLLLPLIAWLAVRTFVFRHASQVYVFPTGGPTSMKLLRNVLLVPTGLYQAPLRSTIDALHRHHWGVVLAHGASLGLNVAAWLLLAAVVARAVRENGRQWLTQPPAPWVTVLLFAAGNLALMCTLEVTALRYGYLWFALGPAALLAGMSGWKHRQAVAWGMAATVLITQAVSMFEALSPDSIAAYQLTKRATRQLNVLLHDLPKATRTVYLLDDIFMRDTSPEFTAKLAGFTGRIVRVNNILPQSRCRAEDPNHYSLHRDAQGTTLLYTKPACLYRPDTAIEVPVGTIGQDGFLTRGPWIKYSFPELSVQDIPFNGGARHYVYGKHWQVRVTDPQCQQPSAACVWIGLDTVRQMYHRIEAAP